MSESLAKLSDSVGPGCKNSPPDVRLVKRLLNAHAAASPPLDPMNGNCADRTVQAIIAFQKRYAPGAKRPGTISPLGATFKALQAKPDAFPQRPGFPALGLKKVHSLFGEFQYEGAATQQEPDAIKIKGTWVRDHIVSVQIPQLARIDKPAKTNIRFHKRAAKQFAALWQAWDDAGLLDRVLTYGGSFVPRFQRGTQRIANKSPLSNHSWGTAFDINMKWNGLKAIPAKRGQKGSVYDLVPIAIEHGFYWGGHFRSRYDGMHFEVAKLVAG